MLQVGRSLIRDPLRRKIFFFLIYLILPAALVPGVYSASNRNEYLTNSVALVLERTIPTEQLPLVGEVSANVCGYRDVVWSVRRIPYGRNLGFLDRTSLEYSHKLLH
jgi:hypothetical protein